jgi:hypothetical protein
MSKPHSSQATFDTLRGILEKHGKRLVVTVDKPGDYQVASPSLKDRIGRPLFVGAVQIRKNYVSYHLIPVYTTPALLETVSPELKKRMQGKSCFNFTSIDATQAKELAALTKAGIAALATLELPWDRTSKSSLHPR